MFEITVSNVSGYFDSFQLFQISSASYKLILNPDTEQSTALNLTVSLTNSRLWDELRKVHENLIKKEAELESFKQEKNSELFSVSRELKEKIESQEKKIENLNLKVEKLQNLKKSLFQEKKYVEEMLNHEREYIKNLEGKIKENLTSSSEGFKKIEERDACFMQRLSDLMKEKLDLQQTVQQLRFAIEEKKSFFQSEDKNFECFGCCEIKTEVLMSKDFYNMMSLTQENLEILYRNMCKVNEESLGKVSFAIDKNLKEENERLSNEVFTLSQNTENLEKELASFIEKNEKLRKELLEKNYEYKEQETFSLKTKQDTLENTFFADSLEIQPTGLMSSNEEPKFQELENKIKDLLDQNNKLSIEICQLKSKTIQELKLERIKVDSLDLLIEKFCYENGYENLFIKIFNGLYLFGSKQLNISYEKDQIYCRYGGFTVTLSAFLKNENFGSLKPLSHHNEKLLQASPRLKTRSSLRENEIPPTDDRKNLKEKVFSPVRKHYKRNF